MSTIFKKVQIKLETAAEKNVFFLLNTHVNIFVL